nr:uncharacterized mitochondrial protein AtMg00810-like [Tanacetum cinerariifolium]
MVNWSDHEAENKTGVVEKAQKEKKEWEVKFEETLARFDKWNESSENLNKLINSSMSTKTELGLGFKQYFGEDEVFDLSIPSTLDPEPLEKRFPPLSKRFVKAGEMHEVPPSITGTFMPTSYKSDLIETQVSYGLKSDSKTSETSSETNDFVSCDNSDKSSDSEAYVSCDSSPDTKTNDSLTTVDVKTVPESDIEDPKSTIVNSVPCKSKAASVPTGSRNSSASVNAGRSDSAASRNKPVVNSTSRHNPAGRIGKAAHHFADQPNPVDTDCLVLTKEFSLPDESQVYRSNGDGRVGLKVELAMLSLRINRFEKKAGRKMNYNNKQPARFDRRKARCYKCLQLGHFARECKVKTVDDKARYSAYKVTEVKIDEPKALVSVDCMVNLSDHEAENKTGVVEKVYGMMVGLNGDHAAKSAASVSDAAAEFAMMGISPQGDPRVDNNLGIVDSGSHRSMIGSLMYLTASRPDIMFALEAYSDSDYAGSHGDRKSTSGGCQFLGRRLISWQCKKQNIVATSSTEAKYVAAASCCGQ